MEAMERELIQQRAAPTQKKKKTIKGREMNDL
jgi:hypothetical protein